MNNNFKCTNQHKGGGNVWAGIILLAIGGVLLAKQFGFLFPNWLFSWPMIPIVIGLFIGVKSNFRDFSSVIIIAIGLIFLLDDIFPDFPVKQFAWPILIIGAGLVLILAPKRSRRRMEMENPLPSSSTAIEVDKGFSNATSTPASTSTLVGDQSVEESLEIVSIFGGIKKRILSKHFRGGEIVSVFGGSEVNLTQADFNHIIEIEIVQIFGGTKLIVPSNWEVRSECFVLLGGLDDKRTQPPAGGPQKILVLKGVTICGGIEIISYY